MLPSLRYFGYKACLIVSAPSAPVLLNGTSAGKHWINIVWAAPKEPNGPVDGYNVTWHNSGHRCESVVVQTTTVNLTSLALNSLYEIKVSAFNNGLRVRKPGPPVELSIRTLSNGKLQAVTLENRNVDKKKPPITAQWHTSRLTPLPSCPCHHFFFRLTFAQLRNFVPLVSRTSLSK